MADKRNEINHKDTKTQREEGSRQKTLCLLPSAFRLLPSPLCVFVVTASQAQKKEGVGLFPVRQDGKWGYINKAGEVIIAPQFDSAQPFSDSLAKVYLSGKQGYIDWTGKFIWKPTK